MKSTLSFLLLSFIIISCSTNNTSQEEDLASLILEDSWFFQRHGETCSNGSDLDERDAYEFRFLSNNTVDFNDPGYLTSSSYTLNGNQLTLETIYRLPSGSMRRFEGNYTYSSANKTFTGNSTFTAYTNTETFWTCTGPCSVFR